MDEKDRDWMDKARMVVGTQLTCDESTCICTVNSGGGKFVGPGAVVKVAASGIGVDFPMALRQCWQQIHDRAEEELVRHGAATEVGADD